MKYCDIKNQLLKVLPILLFQFLHSGSLIMLTMITLTGKGTFHGMGVISALYGLGKNMYTNVIKRNKERRKTSFIDHRGIDILPYSGSFKNGLTTFTLKPYVQLLSPYTPPDVLNYDMLWKTGYLFVSKDLPRPNWSGFMQHVTQKILHFRHSGCLEIVLLVPHQMNIYTFLREEIGLFGSLE